ncbi:MAG: Gfo/Idh/MocA family oxidoreductase [Lentisphaerae bacterium]|nr:Gfo/Idh/MocA family oxidoreductase [Lentisphaerota bacterium]
MPDTSIGVGVIGLGRAGMIHARHLQRGVSGARLVGVADPTPEALARACGELGLPGGHADYRSLLADPQVDAVIVATPTAYHREITVAAAAAGKHVFCEKPMAMTAPECDEMIAATRGAGVKLQIGFMRRFDRSFVQAKERVDRGEIGQVVQVKSLTHGPSTPQRWMYDLRLSNGPLAEVNSHDIDTLRWFTGSEFTTVYAIGANYRCPDARAEFPDFYDNVLLIGSFANGRQGLIGGAQGVKYAYDARVEILGTEGILTIGHLDDTSVVSCTANGLLRPAVRSWMDLFMEAYRAEAEEFLRCIREDRAPHPDGTDGKRAVEVVNAGNESIRTGRPVDLKPEHKP